MLRMSEPKSYTSPHLNAGYSEPEAPAWLPEFLATLMLTGSVREAVEGAGIAFETAWTLRGSEPAFAMYWDRAALVNKGLAAGLEFYEAVAAAEAGVN
jgi:hypothetical protein